MRDGIGQSGSGLSDNRLAGPDLQHNRQTRTADELHVPVRIVTQPRESGGPMKQVMHESQDISHHSGNHHGHHSDHSPMHQHLEQEKMRHEQSMAHQNHHLERHNSRTYDSQHGHDKYKY
jgi:hypothetical protein